MWQAVWTARQPYMPASAIVWPLPISYSTPLSTMDSFPQWTVTNHSGLTDTDSINTQTQFRHRPRCFLHPTCPLTDWPSLAPSALGTSRTAASALQASSSCRPQWHSLKRGHCRGISWTKVVSTVGLPQPQETLSLKFETIVSSSNSIAKWLRNGQELLCCKGNNKWYLLTLLYHEKVQHPDLCSFRVWDK